MSTNNIIQRARESGKKVTEVVEGANIVTIVLEGKRQPKTKFTLVIPIDELANAQVVAKELGVSVAYLMRQAVKAVVATCQLDPEPEEPLEDLTDL
jgi:hypothetical protein